MSTHKKSIHENFTSVSQYKVINKTKLRHVAVGAHQRVGSLVHVVEAHVTHSRVYQPPNPVLEGTNQLVRLRVLLLSSERFDGHEVLQEGMPG